MFSIGAESHPTRIAEGSPVAFALARVTLDFSSSNRGLLHKPSRVAFAVAPSRAAFPMTFPIIDVAHSFYPFAVIPFPLQRVDLLFLI